MAPTLFGLAAQGDLAEVCCICMYVYGMGHGCFTTGCS